MQVECLPLETGEWGVFANGKMLGKRPDDMAATRLLQDVLMWLQHHPTENYVPNWRDYAFPVFAETGC